MPAAVSYLVLAGRRLPETREEWLGTGAMFLMIGVAIGLSMAWAGGYARRGRDADYERLMAESAEFSRRRSNAQLRFASFAELAAELERCWHGVVLLDLSASSQRTAGPPPDQIAQIRHRISVLTSVMKSVQNA
jgi:hypothetical protein